MRAALYYDTLDPDQKLALHQALHGLDALLVLLDLDRELRDAAKHHDDESADRWRKRLWDLMGDHHINLEELVP